MMECHLSSVIYGRVAPRLLYSPSPGEHSGGAACQSVKITSPLCGIDLELGPTQARIQPRSNQALVRCSAQVQSGEHQL